MMIIPAIDVMGGACVRLIKGNFASKKVYSGGTYGSPTSSPCYARTRPPPLVSLGLAKPDPRSSRCGAYFPDLFQVAWNFQKAGAKMIHVVDLDGAKTGRPQNMDTILALKKAVGLPIQVGGGIRNFATAEKYLDGGIDRIIIGTQALEKPKLLERLVRKFGPTRIMAAVDVKNGRVASRGWLNTSKISLEKFLQRLRRLGVSEVVVTDVGRDGTMTAPNFPLMAKVIKVGFRVTAAGGISDTVSIKKLGALGVSDAIVGKALYEGKISLSDALKFAAPLSAPPRSAPSDLAKRIIPCLDVQGGRVVKGIRFKNLRDAGDPVELAKQYAREGADELVFLDITASKEKRATLINLVKKVAKEIFIPFTVGGGVRTVSNIGRLLRAGADKVSINSAAVNNPAIILRAAKKFGSQCVVVAIDAKKTPRGYRIFTRGGTQETDLDVVEWAARAQELGAGEILLTSMNADGTKAGFDVKLLKKISRAITIPVIASGGAGALSDFENAFQQGRADAVLAASLFHFGKFSIGQVKNYLQSSNIPVRI